MSIERARLEQGDARFGGPSHLSLARFGVNSQCDGDLSLGKHFVGHLIGTIFASCGTVSGLDGSAEGVDCTHEVVAAVVVTESLWGFADEEEDRVCSALEGVSIVDDVDDIVVVLLAFHSLLPDYFACARIKSPKVGSEILEICGSIIEGSLSH